MTKLKLRIELVPAPVHGKSLASLLSPDKWKKIKKSVYSRAKYKCEICGSSGRGQGYHWPVECHEIWFYDDEEHIQKLMDFVALCPRCHMVKHAGLASLRGTLLVAKAHFCKVNNCPPRIFDEHFLSEMLVYKERNKFKWTVDYSGLEGSLL